MGKEKMTPAEAYSLYCKFANQFTMYTSEHPEGINVVPDKEWGVTEYKFRGSEALADFLAFVLKEKRNG